MLDAADGAQLPSRWREYQHGQHGDCSSSASVTGTPCLQQTITAMASDASRPTISGRPSNSSAALSNNSRPTRLSRRLSHPPSRAVNRMRTAQEDGEFIKRAFESLAVEPQVASSSAMIRKDTETPGPLQLENADDATPPEYDSIILATRPAGSRASIASTYSQPYSAISTFSVQPDRSSIRSSYPLLPTDPSGTSSSSPPTSSARHRHLRSHSSGINPLHQKNDQPFRPGDGIDLDRSAGGRVRAAERRSAYDPSEPTLALGQIDSNYSLTQSSNNTQVDPFTDPYELERLRLRRRSTISGYSVNISDWNSLRRGSLASLENASPPAATQKHIATSQPRSRQGTHSSDSGSLKANAAYPTAASTYATMARLQQPSPSLRWEAWATAYRESMLQDVHSGLYTLYQPGGARWLGRHASISEETNAGTNHFYHLRRQFVARAGSRSEGNRILVLELCHALEEYEGALGTLCRLSQASSPYTLLSSLTSSIVPKSPSSPPSPTATDPTTFPPSPRYRGQPYASLDKSQLELLADEVDSLVREIIEAVPAFSYSLSQGMYGPLPLRINNQHTTAPDITIQKYLEQVQILHSSYPMTHARPPASLEFALPRPALATPAPSQALLDIEQESLNMEKWWPNRLRIDLREGLLVDDVEDSPNISLQSISVVPSIPYRQDVSGGEPPAGSYENPPSRNNTSDQLLAEGKRRWREYQQGRR